MMILVDAIQLRKRMKMICDRTCPYLDSKNKETMCAACPLGQAFPEVDEAPEVDVIPIWWIILYRNELIGEGDYLKEDTISEMLKKWSEIDD